MNEMSLDDQDLSALIQRHATRHAAGDALRASIGTQLALADAGRTAVAQPARKATGFGWRSAVIGFAFGIATALVVVPLVQRAEFGATLENELVADHVRALKIGPLIDVASSDRHTVKPWFQGRLDYAPPVLDLAGDGFMLSGGRVEHVRGQAVATLAYLYNRHVIDVFVWPVASGEASESLRVSVQRGFSVARWNVGAMQLWAVSDVEQSEIERFARLWQQRAAAR